MTALWQKWQDALLVGAVLLLGGFALAAAGFAHPPTRNATEFTPYEHAASFAYSATAPEGLVYDGSEPRPGEPVFRALSDSVTVRAGYEFRSAAKAAVEGEAALVAIVGNEYGWRREIPLGSPQPLAGGKASLERVLVLADVQRLIDALETSTGVRSREYSLTFEERVTLRGTLAGKPFEDTYTASMRFALDPFQLVLQWPQGDADPFQPSVQRMFESVRTVTNGFRVFAWDVPVPLARTVGGALAGLGLVVVGAVSAAAARRRRGDAFPLTARHRERLVAVRELPLGPATRVIDVFSFDDLARIADQLGTVILCASEGRAAWYAVADGLDLYRFQVAPAVRLERGQKGRAA
ncbi:hypothetical protein HRbin29_01428 [bacterium HR29]|nr:hypothetical protein HRbin29_01428 [bacterium HR29]